MSQKSIMLTGAPYHLLAYGTLLGTTVFNTFVGTIIQFKTLPRLQFSALQTKTFPWYFAVQTLGPVALAVTLPGTRHAVHSLLDPVNRWGTLIPIATTFLSGALNWAVLYPMTTDLIAKRRKQEKQDGKMSWDPPPHSEELTALNKQFGMLHGISSLLNVVNFVATIVYGVTLSARIR